MIEYVNIWTILGVVSIVLLLVSWKKRNATWGGLTLGIFVGLIILAVKYFTVNGLYWFVVLKSAIVGSMIGFVAESLAALGNKLKKR